MNAELKREIYRCPHCGRFVDQDYGGFFDRSNRDDECSQVLVFCNEQHANDWHESKTTRAGAQP